MDVIALPVRILFVANSVLPVARLPHASPVVSGSTQCDGECIGAAGPDLADVIFAWPELPEASGLASWRWHRPCPPRHGFWACGAKRGLGT